MGIVLPVVAAETVILRYQRQSISVPLQELETFVVSGETTESLKGQC
ncbi:MAG: alpha/beta hydrolase [Halothece sp.]